MTVTHKLKRLLFGLQPGNHDERNVSDFYEYVPPDFWVKIHGVEGPDFCITRGVVSSVPVIATSEGLGLPDELCERMEGQRQRQERVALAVHVRRADRRVNLGSGRESRASLTIHY